MSQFTQQERVAAAALAGSAIVFIAVGWFIHATGVDASWLLWAHAHEPSRGAAVAWSCITVLGMGWPAVILLLALDRQRGRITALLVPTFIIGTLLTHAPKHVFSSPRPASTSLRPAMHMIGQALTGPVSMPSGHALTAAAAAALLCVAWPYARRGIFAVMFLASAALVAWSRVVVGAHWPSDVFVGAGLGFVAVAGALALAGRATVFQRAIASRKGQLWLAATELILAAGFVSDRTGYPDARPIVVGVALLAVASAVFRAYAAMRLRQAQPDPAEFA